MAEEAGKYTAFVTPQGQFEFLRMPFGLANAPRIFQRFINQLLRPANEFAAVYLDDVLIHTRNVAEGLTSLTKVFELLRGEGITLNHTKCSFLATSVTFLGFRVSQGKVSPGDDKVEAVRKFPVPETVHQVRQFLGLTGYFRHFVKNYATITKPLTSLLKKTEPWKWTEHEEQAFRTMQAELTKKPVLALYTLGAETEVHTDASSLGIAGILLQKQPSGKFCPVAYFSRQTTSSEAKFHSFELEMLAIY